MLSTNDPEELVIAQFLAFLAKGTAVPLDNALWNQAEDLVRGVEVDVDSVLHPTDE